jgi:hypothetical protein
MHPDQRPPPPPLQIMNKLAGESFKSKKKTRQNGRHDQN